MKRYYIYLTLSLLVAWSASCSKFLEENPESEFATGNFYTDAQSLEAGVVGAYSSLFQLFGIYTNTPLYMTMLGTDECMAKTLQNNIRPIVDRYTYTASEGCVLGFWAGHYKIIAEANEIIEIGPTLTNVNDSIRNKCVAEVRFMRAWAYFRLVQAFGDIPLLNERLSDVSQFRDDKPRDPLKDVYQFIIDDLEFCGREGVLPNKKNGGRATQWAARGLLGKVYLTMASAKQAGRVSGYALIEESTSELYKKAYDVFDDIIKNSGADLLPVYGDVFDYRQKNTNVESLYEIQFANLTGYGVSWPKELGAWYTGGQSGTNAAYRTSPITGSCTEVYVPSFWHYYDANGYDVRRSWNLADYVIKYNASNVIIDTLSFQEMTPKAVVGSNTDANTYKYSGITKYRFGDDWNAVNSFAITDCPTNIYVLRFADILLMFAEADLNYHNGTISSEGLKAINRVIQRARGLKSDGKPVPASETPGFDDYTAATLNMNEIVKERARELCFEFQRWFDLARTGTFETFLVDRNIDSKTSVSFDPKKNYLFPIPQSEIDRSTNPEGFYQNPGY
jgi:hypothetical protein